MARITFKPKRKLNKNKKTINKNLNQDLAPKEIPEKLKRFVFHFLLLRNQSKFLPAIFNQP